jgi:hypothetical protein
MLEPSRCPLRVGAGHTQPSFTLSEKAIDRAAALTDLYRKQLRTIARFVRSFELRDKNDRVVYHLFFASKNSLGHLKMKEAMWKVDPRGEFRFSDATNPQQQVFFRSAYQSTSIRERGEHPHRAR